MGSARVILKQVSKISDKVLILGTIPTWNKAPLGDKSWEVWGMNAFWNTWGKYATRWFEIHPMSIILRDGWQYYKWMEDCKIPIYMLKHYNKVPSSIPFPIAEISKGFMKQFSSTFCYQMALAIYEGFKTIGLYGVDFSGGTLRERFIEWRSILYWIGVATGRGIKIQYPDGSSDVLSHRYLYGLEYWKEIGNTRLQILKAYNQCSVFDGVTARHLPRRRTN